MSYNGKNHIFLDPRKDEILEIFDTPAFLEGYDLKHSENEDRYYGMGSLNDILCVIVFYTLRKRTRIISARQADGEEHEEYDDYFKKAKS